MDDMVASNGILYDPKEKPDHCVSVCASVTIIRIIRGKWNLRKLVRVVHLLKTGPDFHAKTTGIC